MPRLLFALVCAILAVSLASASVAHAVETNVCVEQGYSDSAHPDEGERPDPGKGYPDHPVNCHWHQLASIATDSGDQMYAGDSGLLVAPDVRELHSALSAPGLRPPQA